MDTTAAADFDDALARVFARVERASKDAQNPHLKNRYATLASVDEAIRSALIAEEFSWPQYVTTRRAEGVLEVVIRTELRRKGHKLEDELPMPVGGKASAQEIGSAITYGRRYALSAMLGVCTEDDDGHAASARPKAKRDGARDQPPPPTEPEPDRLWQAYEDARATAAKHLRVTEPQAHQRILHLAEVREDPDMPDDDVRKLIGVAEALLLTDREPANEPAAKPKATKGKAKPEPAHEPTEPRDVQAARKAADSARAAYQDTCREEGIKERPWLDIAYNALGGKPWDIAKGSHGVEDYEALAAEYEREIDRARGGA